MFNPDPVVSLNIGIEPEPEFLSERQELIDCSRV